MNIIKAKDYRDLSRKAANIISAQVIINPDCVLGLATGSSPLGTYSQLIDRYKQGDLDFSRVRSVNLDEYKGLSHTNSHSYYYFMNENLFKHINIVPENTYVPNGMDENSERACSEHDEVIRNVGGIDLQLLGLGHNGHIGFNEPGDFFPKGTHCVTLAPSTISANARFFEKPRDVPTQAYTMGIQSIMRAKKILVIVSGQDKADIVNKAFFGQVTPLVPASILQLHPDVTIVADEAALSACPESLW